MNDVVERFREAARACQEDVFWTPRRTPAEAMAAAAKATEELGIDQWDVYAERGAVAELFADGEADAINERAIAFMDRTRVQPCGVWRPGRSLAWPRARWPCTRPPRPATSRRWPRG